MKISELATKVTKGKNLTILFSISEGGELSVAIQKQGEVTNVSIGNKDNIDNLVQFTIDKMYPPTEPAKDVVQEVKDIIDNQLKPIDTPRGTGADLIENITGIRPTNPIEEQAKETAQVMEDIITKAKPSFF